MDAQTTNPILKIDYSHYQNLLHKIEHVKLVNITNLDSTDFATESSMVSTEY